MLVIGKITGCYGLKGWVKIHSYTETPENFLGFGAWQLKRRGAFEPVEFDVVKRQGRGLVAHIAGVDDRTLAESYRGLEVAVPEGALPALPEGDYYWRDLQGLRVWCVYRKGKAAPVGDGAIRTAFRDAGWMDIKSCAVSAAWTATLYRPPMP